MKIPCSVSIITLNVEKELPRCLENLKDFQEIIICDGNSIDKTVEIAHSFGAKVIKQYNTDEKETRCAMDKAAVRQRAMDASSLTWRFFMDADDTLSKEAIEEIKEIVTSDDVKFFVYKMPTVVEIEGRSGIIDHQASSPGYQTRLVHKDVGAHFIGHVHERLKFDEDKFPPGELKHPYVFHWSKDRFQNFWSFLRTYVAREVYTTRHNSLREFLYWGWYWRVRSIFGYLWRIIKTYTRYGVNGTMPLNIEFTVVRYHLSILLRMTFSTFSRLFFVRFIGATLKGKDSYRFLSNWSLRHFELYGNILDIGGGPVRASHYSYFISRLWNRIKTVDIIAESKPDILADISKDVLPIKEGAVDTILLMNVLEHVRNVPQALNESYRVLKKGGVVYAVVPFFVNVHPDPSDYWRFTEDGLREVFERANFSCERIIPFGTGPFLAAHYQIEMTFPRIVRLISVPLAMFLDYFARMIKPKIAIGAKFPLGYTIVATKL